MVQELGRLVFDVEVKEVGKGEKSAVVNNRIAIQNSKNSTTFLDIVAWNGTANIIGKYLKKGDEIFVSGTLINSKKKKNDVEFETVELLVNNIKFVHGNKRDNLEDIPDFLQ